MSAHSEFEIWREAWKTSVEAVEPETGFDVRAEAIRHERGLRAKYVFELAFAVALIAFAALVLSRDFRAETLAWAIVVWITTVAAASFAIWNWRSVWRTSHQSTSEYAIAYRKRCIASLRAVRFGYRFLTVQVAIAVPWLTWDFYRRGAEGRFSYAMSLLLLALLTAVFLFAFRRSRRSASSRLARLDEFERSRADEE